MVLIIESFVTPYTNSETVLTRVACVSVDEGEEVSLVYARLEVSNKFCLMFIGVRVNFF